VTNAILLEELAHGDAALALAALAPSLFAYSILDQGSEDQKRALLPGFCGEQFVTGSLAVSEPGALSDASEPLTRAEQKGETFILSGRKTFVVFGDRASHFLVTARLGDDLGAFIVPRDTEGLVIGEVEKKMGLHALPTTSLSLERVEVGPEALLGGPGGADVQRLLNASRAGLAAVMLGVSRAVLEFCVPYSKDRVAFDEPISKKQSIAFRLAEMHIEQHALPSWCGRPRAFSSTARTPRKRHGRPVDMRRRKACGSRTTGSRCSAVTASFVNTPSRCGSGTRERLVCSKPW
jgi:alkylation response protein AidB-like acyl-CoA dehydrogenase